MSSYSQSLTAQGATQPVSVKPGDSLAYSASGTFTGYASLQKSTSPVHGWTTVTTGAADTAISGTVKNETVEAVYYRVHIKDTDALTPVTGTLVCAFVDEPVVLKRVVNAAGQAKAGTTAGFVVAAGNNIGLVTVPAGVTAGTCVVPLPFFREGTKIRGFSLIGQIESAGNAVTVDADLRKHTAAAADVSDASVGSITQLSVTADTIMSSSNTRKYGLDEIVAVDKTYYVLITVTTGASTDVALQGVVIEYQE